MWVAVALSMAGIVLVVISALADRRGESAPAPARA